MCVTSLSARKHHDVEWELVWRNGVSPRLDAHVGLGIIVSLPNSVLSLSINAFWAFISFQPIRMLIKWRWWSSPEAPNENDGIPTLGQDQFSWEARFTFRYHDVTHIELRSSANFSVGFWWITIRDGNCTNDVDHYHTITSLLLTSLD